MQALRHFYDDMGDKLWTEYGFIDAFNETRNWYASRTWPLIRAPLL